MVNSFNNMSDNTDFRNSQVVRDTVSTLSAFLFKKYCDYTNANESTKAIFKKMATLSSDMIDLLKQSFSSRNVSTENIWVKFDQKAPAIVLNILWISYSFTMRCNFKPQYYLKEGKTPIIANRIIAVKGDYEEIVKDAKTPDEEISALLDHEIASLYIPENKYEPAIIKEKENKREAFITQTDAGRDFVLGVSNIICGDKEYHLEGTIKSFRI